MDRHHRVVVGTSISSFSSYYSVTVATHYTLLISYHPWFCHLKAGRLTAFDGSLLHGVIPGRGPSPKAGGVGGGAIELLNDDMRAAIARILDVHSADVARLAQTIPPPPQGIAV
jgi:hypothetical protein